MTPGSRLDPDRLLALSYVPFAQRPRLAALWELDELLAGIATSGREPMLARIKLAWWRDALEALDTSPPPGEPTLQAAATQLLPAGVSGVDLARLAEAWDMTLEDPAGVEAHAAARGSALFGLSARLLKAPPFEALAADGAIWALTDLSRRQGRRVSNSCVALKQLWPTSLRPLGMLVALSDRDRRRGDWERQGSPGRILRMLRHRLTGR